MGSKGVEINCFEPSGCSHVNVISDSSGQGQIDIWSKK